MVILVIEDEKPILRFLQSVLTLPNYEMRSAENGQLGLSMAASHRPDLVLLDLGLPDMDGMEVLKRLREWSQTPVIIVTARGREQDKIKGLDAGADDYLTKPFSTGELLARIRVCMRRSEQNISGPNASTYTSGDLKVDFAKRQVFLKSQEVHLTPIEYDLLSELVRHVGKVLTHGHLLKAVWGPNNTQDVQYLRVFMRQLRMKLEAEPAHPKFILTEPGIGYRLRETL